MTDAEISWLNASVAVWQNYDSSVKADLWSCAVRDAGHVFIIDPIRLAAADLDALTKASDGAAVIVSNENHFRASDWYCGKFDAPLFLHHDIADQAAGAARIVALREGAEIDHVADVIELAGAPRGEVAIFFRKIRLVVVGDALINFEPHGFTFLPDRYCTNPKAMRQSLHKLLRHDFDQMVFAHGTPIRERARARLEDLLRSEL